MKPVNKFTRLRRFNIATHRDLGYFFSTLILVYCISGLALNHINDWNPDFVITRRTVPIDTVTIGTVVNSSLVNRLGQLVGEDKYKVYDVPTTGQVKIYYDNASFHVNFQNKQGVYEKVARRPVFYHSNIFHRNSVKGWRWFADVFAVMLTVLNISGLFILKGKKGITGRGKWLILAGLLPPILFYFIQELV
jgi:uncharacterized protein